MKKMFAEISNLCYNKNKAPHEPLHPVKMRMLSI